MKPLEKIVDVYRTYFSMRADPKNHAEAITRALYIGGVLYACFTLFETGISLEKDGNVWETFKAAASMRYDYAFNKQAIITTFGAVKTITSLLLAYVLARKGMSDVREYKNRLVQQELEREFKEPLEKISIYSLP